MFPGFTVLLLGSGMVIAEVPGGTTALSETTAVPVPSSTVTIQSTPLASATTAVAPVALGATTLAPSAKPPVPARAPTPLGRKPKIATTAKAAPAKPKPKPKGPPPVPFEDLHKRATIVIMPSAYAAHVHKSTGENLEVFLAWYIGTLYTEQGLFIAPLFSLFIGADAKWAFLAEKKYRPAVATGYYGGMGLPFTGGAVQATSLAEKEVRQTFMHNVYGVMSKRFGSFTVSGGTMYGFKKAFPRFLPMLRNSKFSDPKKPNQPSEMLVTAFGGLDLEFKGKHIIKIEVITVPQERMDRPWLIQSRVEAFLGFDIAYLKDRFGYEVMGYYLLPFIRWPNKKRLEKERERLRLWKR